MNTGGGLRGVSRGPHSWWLQGMVVSTVAVGPKGGEEIGVRQVGDQAKLMVSRMMVMA